MGRTLAQMRGAVVRNLGAWSGDTEFVNLDTSELNELINEALAEIDAEHDWPWNEAVETITTSQADPTYVPTTGWYRTSSLAMGDYGPMTLLSPDDAADRWPTATDTGVPRYYFVHGGTIYLTPSPDGVHSITHLYYTEEPDLVDDGDEPLLPDRFRVRVIDSATAKGASKLRLWACVQHFQNRDPGHAKRMLDDVRSTKATTSVRARRDTWGQV